MEKPPKASGADPLPEDMLNPTKQSQTRRAILGTVVGAGVVSYVAEASANVSPSSLASASNSLETTRNYKNRASLSIAGNKAKRLDIATLNEPFGDFLFVDDRVGNKDIVKKITTFDPSIRELQSMLVPPASDPSGSNGAWIRQHDGSELNVKWLGARGDGVQDDTEALIAAASMAAQKTLLFPFGTFPISRPLVIWGNTHVRGTNRWSCRLLWRGGNGKPSVNVRRPIEGSLDYPINAIMVLSFFSEAGGPTLGGQKVSGLQFSVDTAGGFGGYKHHCDSAIYVDAPTTTIDECYLNGTPHKFDKSLIEYSRNTTFNSKVTNNVMRGMSGEGNYQARNFGNLTEQTPVGVQVGACQALIIAYNTIQNCKHLINMAPKRISTTPVLRLTSNHLEQGYNTNDPDNRILYCDKSIQLLVQGNECFYGPHNHSGAGNPAPHIGFEIDGDNDSKNGGQIRNAVFTGNTHRIVSSSTYDSSHQGPYFMHVKGSPQNVLSVHIDKETFIGRKYPVAVSGNPIIHYGINNHDFTIGGEVTYLDINNNTADRPLPPNDSSPFLGNGSWRTTNNTVATTITDFQGGSEGSTHYIRVNDHKTAIQFSATGGLRSDKYRLYRSSEGDTDGWVKLSKNTMIAVYCFDRRGAVYYVDLIDGPLASSTHQWFEESIQLGSYKLWIYNDVLYMKDVVKGGLPTSPTDGIRVSPK